MLAEDEVIQGVGSSDEEMEPEGENENQATKEKTLRSTRQQRITPESDVEDIAEVPQSVFSPESYDDERRGSYSLEYDTGSSLEEDLLQMGGLSNGSSSDDELDGWAEFDEEGDDLIPQMRDEMVTELETMLGPDYDSDMWDNHVYHIFGLGNISQCCIIRGACFDRTRP
ncbi:hypothetical protein K443DRAFT_13778 [Laccaria amethystina LaAM-08-1]|uniref:Uncharacterized protein n=1 Tax=Laccaria amethystina LaAM-08-1 TaxID=1095629 RepID=A0A0C9WNS0_9AGAR|nr:hypothetical protein K443DRAFT_13778 [Laccaria amethystina LaAM-08-1]